MKKFLTSIIISATLFAQLLLPHAAEARSYRTRTSDTYVLGYTTRRGTYVQPYYRSAPDNSKRNNYGCIDYGRCR